jgi:hypothetical protein
VRGCADDITVVSFDGVQTTKVIVRRDHLPLPSFEVRQFLVGGNDLYVVLRNPALPYNKDSVHRLDDNAVTGLYDFTLVYGNLGLFVSLLATLGGRIRFTLSNPIFLSSASFLQRPSDFSEQAKDVFEDYTIAVSTFVGRSDVRDAVRGSVGSLARTRVFECVLFFVSRGFEVARAHSFGRVISVSLSRANISARLLRPAGADPSPRARLDLRRAERAVPLHHTDLSGAIGDAVCTGAG